MPALPRNPKSVCATQTRCCLVQHEQAGHQKWFDSADLAVAYGQRHGFKRFDFMSKDGVVLRSYPKAA